MSPPWTLGLAAAVLLLWLLVRQARKKDDPHEQHRQRYRAIDRALAQRRPGRLDPGLADDLDELDRLSNRKGDPGRSGGHSR